MKHGMNAQEGDLPLKAVTELVGLRVCTVKVKHNVTQEEALAWHGSAECMKRVYELEDLGREKFGKDHWMKWNVSYFWTIAAN